MRRSDDKLPLLEESIELDWKGNSKLTKSITSSKHNTKSKFGSVIGRRDSAVSVEMPYITEPTMHEYYRDAPIVKGGVNLQHEAV